MKNLIIIVSVLAFAGCSNMKNSRQDNIVEKRTGDDLICPTPPADMVQTLEAGDGKLSLKVNAVQSVALDSSLSFQRKFEKIRNIDPQLQTVETVHYRLCIEYANGTFTKEEYKEIIQGLPLYSTPSRKKSSSNDSQVESKINFPIKSPIAPLGTWMEESLGLAVKVKWIGGTCLSPCEPIIKAGLEITTSSSQMPNYEAAEGFSTAFTHNNKTYKLTIEKINSEPSYIVVAVDRIKT